MNTIITADSACDLPYSEIKARRNIAVIPLKVILGDSEYRDGVDMDAVRMVDIIEQEKVRYSTSAASIGDYIDFFRPLSEKYEKVIHISVGGAFSSCYGNSVLAAREFNNVAVVDSKNISSGLGLLVLHASEMAESGYTAEEIVESVTVLSRNIRFSFLIEKLDYLKNGGRCSALASFSANVLGIKISIDSLPDRLAPGKKYRGAMKKCVEQYVINQLEAVNNAYKRAIVVQIGIDDAIIAHTLDYLKATGRFDEVLLHNAGCVIGAHCGPGTIGLCIAEK